MRTPHSSITGISLFSGIILLCCMAFTSPPQRSVPVLNLAQFQPYLEKNNDTVYVINFWATWCKPCIEELPAFEKVTATATGKPVKVILVSLDFENRIQQQLLPFLEKHHIRSEVVVLSADDENAMINAISPEWSGAIPATIIYKGGNRKFYEKTFTFEELNTEIASFIQPK